MEYVRNDETKGPQMNQSQPGGSPAKIPGTLYSIGEVADILGVSIPLIRLYEREGLIIPMRRDSKHRRYSMVDIDRIRSVRRMINEEKVSMEGLKRLLSLVPCWKINGCDESAVKECGAYNQHNVPCWIAEHRGDRCESVDCRTCSVYAEYSDFDSIKKIIAR